MRSKCDWFLGLMLKSPSWVFDLWFEIFDQKLAIKDDYEWFLPFMLKYLHEWHEYIFAFYVEMPKWIDVKKK